MHALHAVGVGVAEQAVLPAAERVVRTGIGTLTPIIPTSTSFWKRRAAPPSLVKMAVPLPYWLELIRSSASS